jgi:hypothetical protein
LSIHNDPYISVVVTARNDNHGENMLGRMQAFLSSWILQAQRYNIPSEIIIVEWNPPPDRPPLKDALRWPENTGLCDVRFVEVPAEVHASIPHAKAVPLHQMIAKNVGIRRARGRFVLATNIDIIFSAELMQFIAERRLEPCAFYRMDRYDVASNIPPAAELDELLDFCRSHIQRVAAREGTWSTDGSNDLRPVEPNDIIAPDSGIRLGRGWYTAEQYATSPILRYVEPTAEIAFERPSSHAHILFDVEIGPSRRLGRLEWDVLDPTGIVVASTMVVGRDKLQLTVPADLHSGRLSLRVRNGGVAMVQDSRMLNLRVFGIAWSNGDAAISNPASTEWKFEAIDWSPAVDRTGNCPAPSPHAASMRNPVYLHTNACGDFTLLSREAWFALRAYPEFPIWPTHVDALLCYAAYHAGFPEVILRDPLRVFHVQHQTIWTPEREEEIIARAAVRGVPILKYQTLLKYVHCMRRFNTPLVFSGENWGLAAIDLPETVV